MQPTILLTILWTASIGDIPEAGYSSATVAGERIFITGNLENDSTIFCLNAADGTMIWKYRNGEAWTDMFIGTRCTPLMDGGLLYDESPHGELVCLESATGKMVWRRNLLEDYETPNLLYGRRGSFRIEENNLYVQLGGDKGAMICLDKKTGATQWLGESTGHAAGYGMPMLCEYQGVPMIAAMDAKGLFAINRKTGKLLFHVRHPARLDENIFDPIYHDGKIFISNGAGSDSKLLQLSVQGEAVSAEEVWSNALLANSSQGVVLRRGLLYGATNKRGSGFACIRWDDGSDVFFDRTIVRGAFDIAEDMFFVMSEFGEIVVAKPSEKNFDVLSRLQLPDADGGQAYAHPVVCGNRIYARIGPVLYCIEW